MPVHWRNSRQNRRPQNAPILNGGFRLDVVSTRKSKVPAIQIGMILPKNRANTWIAGKKAR
jgi:hypothetical protein